MPELPSECWGHPIPYPICCTDVSGVGGNAAKWWNEGFQPNRGVSNEWDTPWRKLDPAIFVESNT